MFGCNRCTFLFHQTDAALVTKMKKKCTDEGVEVNFYKTADCSDDPVDAVSTVVKWESCHKANSKFGVISYLKIDPHPFKASGAIGLKAAAAAVLAIAASQF